MNEVYVVITNYLVSQEPPSCEVFISSAHAKKYVLDSIERDVTESERYESDPIWKDRVLKACEEAHAAADEDPNGDYDETLYQYAVECYNDTGAHPQYEEYWVFARKAQ